MTIKILFHVASTRLVTSNLEIFSGLLLRTAQGVNEATRVFEPAMLTGSIMESFIQCVPEFSELIFFLKIEDT